MNKNHQVIKFKNRAASYLSDKRIADSYSKGANFDVDLITADDKIVSAHRFVLAMFSKYLAKILLDLPFDGKILVPLQEIPYDVMRKIVELIYMREITVTKEMEPKVQNALKLLRIDCTYSDSDFLPQANVARKSMPAMSLPNNSQNALEQTVQNGSMNMQSNTYTAGKRKRAQSTFVESSSREFGAVQNVHGFPGVNANVQLKPASKQVNVVSAQHNPTNVKLPSSLTLKKVSHPVDANDGQFKMPNQIPAKLPAGLTIQKAIRPAEKIQISSSIQVQPKQKDQSPIHSALTSNVLMENIPKVTAKPVEPIADKAEAVEESDPTIDEMDKENSTISEAKPDVSNKETTDIVNESIDKESNEDNQKTSLEHFDLKKFESEDIVPDSGEEHERLEIAI